MKIKLKYIIVLLYVLAVISIITSTWYIAKVLPSLDDQIDSKRGAIQIVLQNQNLYQNLLQSTTIMITQWNLLIEINQTSKEFNNMHVGLSLLLKQMLNYQNLALYGRPPTDSKLQKWDNLSIPQLMSVHYVTLSDAENNTDTAISIYDLKDVQNEINILGDKKNSTIFFGVLLSILGLLLTHLAIILDRLLGKK